LAKKADRDGLESLYAAPRDRFVTERNALAEQLRRAGDTDEAARVEALRKPTLVVWALNQLTRSVPKQVEQLLDVHAKILAAESADELRRASEARQKTLGDLTARAVQILDEAGNSGAQARDKIQLTLLALGSNPEAAELFSRGQLSQEVEPGSSWDLAVVPTDRTRSDESVAEKRQLDRSRKEVLALQQRAEKLEQRAEQAARNLEDARREAKAAARAARDARQEADRRAAEIAKHEAANRRKGDVP
jgi:hypothetical protein